MLSFAVASVAQVAHQHNDATSTTTASHVLCGYCVSFSGLATAPQHTAFASVDNKKFAPPASSVSLGVSVRPLTSARPRAPPVK
jgi:hypothetical protein